MNPRVSAISCCLRGALLLAAAVLLAGCGALQLGLETSTPTARPTPAATASPPAAATPSRAAPTLPPATVAASATTPPAVTTHPQATLTPASPPVVVPTGQPSPANPTALAGQPQVAEAILILTPGGSSKVSSPVRVSGEADPTFEQNLVVEIADASGAVIARQSTTIQGSGAARGPFDIQVPFNVSTGGPGRISVYSTSARDGGLLHLASAEVMLATGAVAAPVAGQTHVETQVISEPAPQANLSGGSLHVSGFSDYVFESQLALALCGEGGTGAPDPVCGTVDNVLATGSATISAPDVGQPGPFAGDLSYQVSKIVHARLAVYSRSARDGGIVHLSTVPVQLAP